MSEEAQKKLENIRRLQKEMEDEEIKLLQELGMAPSSDLTSEVDRQKQLAKTFDELTPQERIEMFRNRPDEWQKAMDAIESVGIRELMRW